MKAKRFLIVGCGRFGRRAFRVLLDRYPHAFMEVVDRDPQALESVTGRNSHPIIDDGVEYMARALSQPHGPQWVIPTAPLHIVYHWVMRMVENHCTVEQLVVPAEITFPGEVRSSPWEVFSSLADFLCPEECPGPRAGRCHHTGQPRERPLYRILEDIRFGRFISRVVRSHQLAPGVGGIRSSDLLVLLDEIASVQHPFLLSTASSCHGVTAALRVVCPGGKQTPSSSLQQSSGQNTPSVCNEHTSWTDGIKFNCNFKCSTHRSFS